jgi:peptide/nickel transport system substrate-binding protein
MERMPAVPEWARPDASWPITVRHMRRHRAFAGFLAGFFALCGSVFPHDATRADVIKGPAIAMHGKPTFPDMAMPYVNPAAPKGGRLVFGVTGTFDSLNPMIVKGLALPQIRGYVVESLLARGNDEAFTLYALLAESVETDDARSYVTFRINPKAKFSDGSPVTAEDVLFSRELLRTRGRPNHRLFYSKVVKAEALDRLTVRFDLGGVGDRELPLILGLMPILPKHAIDEATFEETSLTAPMGSGPYTVGNVRAGASVTLTRNPDYWGRDLPINRGMWNFDEVRFEYFRDANTAFEAYKRGLYDFRVETEPRAGQPATTSRRCARASW